MGIYVYSRREFLKKVGLGAAAIAAGKPTVLKGLSSPAPSPSGLRDKFPGPIHGVVFTDLNRNGRKDPDEPVRAGVAVSDGLDVVLTGPDGRYELDNKKGDAPFVFVVQPSDSGKTPTMFYRLPFRMDSETTEINFGLFPAGSRANPTRTRFVQITDTHTTNR